MYLGMFKYKISNSYVMKKIAVIGAGISGLSCAYSLQKAGFSVEVFEKTSFLGGRMSTNVKNGFHFDIGADHLSNLYTELIDSCKEYDVEWEKMRFLIYSTFRNGKLKPILKSISILARMRLFFYTLFIKNKPLDFLNLSTTTDYDTENAYDYMHRTLGLEVVDYVVDPFISAYQFQRAKDISKSALVSVMQSLKFQKDDWYLHRTKGGMIALPEALAKKFTVHLKTPVKKIESKKGKVKVDNKIYDAVVCASTADVTHKILVNPSVAQKKLLDAVRYSSTISVAFTVPQGTLEGIGVVWVPFKENGCISSYINEEMKGDECIQNGRSLVSIWLHDVYAKTLMSKSRDEIFLAVQKEFLKVCPNIINESDLKLHDLQIWEKAMPLYSQGYLTHVKEFLDEGQGEDNIYFCGDYLNSTWTEGAFRCGQRVADQIIKKYS